MASHLSSMPVRLLRRTSGVPLFRHESRIARLSSPSTNSIRANFASRIAMPLKKGRPGEVPRASPDLRVEDTISVACFSA
jgi:hypothetical protein